MQNTLLQTSRFALAFLLLGWTFFSCQSSTEEQRSAQDSSAVAQIAKQLEEAAPSYLRPADEALIEPDLPLLRDSLIACLEQVNLEALEGLCAKDFQWKKGDTLLNWQQSQPFLQADSSLTRGWAALLKRGGAFETKERKRFQAPYWRADFPFSAADSSLGFVDGASVSFRTAPNINAKLINRLNYEVVKRLPLDEDKRVYETHDGKYAAWLLVRVLETEKEGYLFGGFYQSIQTDALWLEKKQGTWRLALVESPAG